MAGHTKGHTHGYVITTKNNDTIRGKSNTPITQVTLRQIATLLGVPDEDAQNIASILLGNLDDNELR